MCELNSIFVHDLYPGNHSLKKKSKNGTRKKRKRKKTRKKKRKKEKKRKEAKQLPSLRTEGRCEIDSSLLSKMYVYTYLSYIHQPF